MDLIKLKRELIEQKNSKFKGNIYHCSEVAFAYNSNKIEGGKLTEDETEEGEKRSYLKLPAKIAPIKAAILPLVNKQPLTLIAEDIETTLRSSNIITSFDGSGTIGRRYARADEIGIPYAITIDYDTVDDKKVTIRNRDTFKQKRVEIEKLSMIINNLVEGHINFEDIEE